MTRLDSRAIADTRVYAQDTRPSDTRDGIMWVDTSDPSRPLAVYSEDSGQWEPVKTDVPVFVTQEAVSYEEPGVNLSGGTFGVRNGALELPYSRLTVNSHSTSSNSGWYGVALDIDGRLKGTIEGVVETSTSLEFSDAQLYDHTNGQEIKTQAGTYQSGDVVSMEVDVTDIQLGFHLYNGSSRAFYDENFTVNEGYTHTRALNSYQSGTGTTRSMYNFEEVRISPTSETVYAGFDSIPTDLQGWDIQTWQQYLNAGSLTVDVETNDGSGWTTHATDVLPPVDISDVPTTSDVRAKFNLSRPAATDTPPRIPYVARRGER